MEINFFIVLLLQHGRCKHDVGCSLRKFLQERRRISFTAINGV